MDERVAGGRRGSFLAAGACPSGALGSPAGAHVSGEPVDVRTFLDRGRRAGGRREPGSPGAPRYFGLAAPVGRWRARRGCFGPGAPSKFGSRGRGQEGWVSRPAASPGWVVLWKFVPFDPDSSNSPPNTPLRISSNYKSDLFFYELVYF